jgi:hypothetical protein
MVLGDDHPGTQRPINNLAPVRRKLGKLQP